jgi:hypothetical protein
MQVMIDIHIMHWTDGCERENVCERCDNRSNRLLDASDGRGGKGT